MPVFGFPADVVSAFESSTANSFSISETELTLAPTANNPALLLPEFDGLQTLGFGADRSEEVAVNAGPAAYGSGWDFLWNSSASITISAVPEPTTGALLLAGALLFGGSRFRKKLN